MKRAAAAILLTVCILASVTLAQPPQQAPKPDPEHKWMDYYVGRWTGEADVKASPSGPAGKLTYTEDVEWAHMQRRQALLLGLSFNLYRLKHRCLFLRMSTEPDDF